MTTLRKALTNAGIHWDTAVIVWQESFGYSPGWSSNDEVGKPQFIPNDHAVLDIEFDSGYGAPQMPRFIAKDHEKIFFPVQYDGATFVEWVCQSLTPYVEGKEPFPYPGG